MTIRTSGLVFKIAVRAKALAMAAPVRAQEPYPERTERRPETKFERPTARRARPERFTRARVVSGTSRLARMLALAHRVERAIEDGELRDLAEAAERLGISRPRMTQIARLAVLSPAIQEAILDGRLDTTERELRSVSEPLAWVDQKTRLLRTRPLGSRIDRRRRCTGAHGDHSRVGVLDDLPRSMPDRPAR